MKTGFISSLADDKDISWRPIDLDSMLKKDLPTEPCPRTWDHIIWEPGRCPENNMDAIPVIRSNEKDLILTWI
jgi:hypothetical protein